MEVRVFVFVTSFARYIIGAETRDEQFSGHSGRRGTITVWSVG